MTTSTLQQDSVRPGAIERFRTYRKSSPVVGGAYRVVRNPAGLVAVVGLLLLALMAFVIPAAFGMDPFEQTRGARLLNPSWNHFFGTDEAGRDLFTRVLFGLRTSFLVGVMAVAIGSVVGSTVGYVAGYMQGIVDAILMRIIDAMLAFPNLLMALTLIVVLGSGQEKVALAIALTNIPIFARLSRAAMLGQLRRDYVLAARTIGASPFRIVRRHIIINTFGPLTVQVALSMAYAVLIEAGLSYLGLGVQPPDPSLGNLMSVGRNYMLSGATHYVLFPAFTLAALMLTLNLLADSMNDAFDPRRRR
jgi:peptide/nickel transport system permease protein